MSGTLPFLPLYSQLCRQISRELQARLVAPQLPSQSPLSPNAGATAAQAFPQDIGGRGCVQCLMHAV